MSEPRTTHRVRPVADLVAAQLTEFRYSGLAVLAAGVVGLVLGWWLT